MAADLHKQDNIHRLTPNERISAWLNRHAPLLLVIFIFLLFLLIVALIVALFNVAAAPTGTEANVYYYHLEDII